MNHYPKTTHFFSLTIKSLKHKNLQARRISRPPKPKPGMEEKSSPMAKHFWVFCFHRSCRPRLLLQQLTFFDWLGLRNVLHSGTRAWLTSLRCSSLGFAASVATVTTAGWVGGSVLHPSGQLLYINIYCIYAPYKDGISFFFVSITGHMYKTKNINYLRFIWIKGVAEKPTNTTSCCH